MTQQDIIESTVERNRSRWGVVMVLLFLYVVVYEPWYYLFGVLGIAFVSYHLMLLATIAWLEMALAGKQLTHADRLEAVERLNELAGKGVTEGEEVEYLKARAGITNETVVTFSDEVIGRFMDNPIYAWIEMGPEGATERYVFDDIAQRDKAGNFMPNLDGGVYAQLHGINYKRVEPAVQPAKSAP